jgi:hypothetical protein
MGGMPGAGGAPPADDPAGGPTIEEIVSDWCVLLLFVLCFDQILSHTFNFLC